MVDNQLHMMKIEVEQSSLPNGKKDDNKDISIDAIAEQWVRLCLAQIYANRQQKMVGAKNPNNGRPLRKDII